MINEGASEINAEILGESAIGYNKETEEEEEGRSLSTFSDKEGDSKDLTTAEKPRETDFTGEDTSAVSKMAKKNEAENDNVTKEGVGSVEVKSTEQNESEIKLVKEKIKDLRILSKNEENTESALDPNYEEGEDISDSNDAENQSDDKQEKQNKNNIARIPRRRSRSPSLEEGQSLEEYNKVGDSLSTNNSGIDSGFKKKRKRAGSGWDAPSSGGYVSPNIPPASNSNLNSNISYSGISNTLTGINSGGSSINNSVMSSGHSNTGGHTGGGGHSSRQTNQIARIYVGSLDYSLNEADLKQVFGSFGPIINIDMPREGNRSKGFCFIEYTTQESAEMALATMNRFVLKGRPIRVGRPTNTNNASSSTSNIPNSQNNLGIGNNVNGFNINGNNMGVNGAGGNVNPSIAVINNKHSHPSHLVQPESGHGSSLQGSVNGPPTHSQNRIYIGSVPYSFTTDDLRHIFKAFGVILSCQLIPSIEKPGTHRGYGFIEFSTADQAKLAIETMNGFEVGGKQLKVNVATALKPHGGNSSNSAGSGGASTQVGGVHGGSSMGQIPIIPQIQNVLQSQISSIPMPHQIVLPSMVPMQNMAPPPPPINPLYQQPPGFPLNGAPQSYGIQNSPTGQNSNIILLTNMVGPDEIDDELKEEVKIECSKYGKVYDVRIHVSNNLSKPSDRVRIFVVFESPSMAQIAVPALNNRWFGGNQVFCSLYNPERYYSSFFDD
ncbi:Ro ribonucleoprotein-binding protein 1 [Cryptosporidium ryanae]|uniref:Ro ribonucleoprotein-binding protein 1 n=1 Tax=Cryptosporidium ryanae TaxID=515981 RepID=UPI00351A36F7|nr:Ro ribonucleoprotein-binding protein 1 [Cryptosporidium ryanae]